MDEALRQQIAALSQADCGELFAALRTRVYPENLLATGLVRDTNVELGHSGTNINRLNGAYLLYARYSRVSDRIQVQLPAMNVDTAIAEDLGLWCFTIARAMAGHSLDGVDELYTTALQHGAPTAFPDDDDDDDDAPANGEDDAADFA